MRPPAVPAIAARFDIPLQRVRTLMVVAKQASLSAAGKHLGLTQSAASRCIRRLESEVGAPLFVRSCAGTSLTPVGAQFRDLGAPLLKAWADALGDLDGWRAAQQGQLSLAADAEVARWALPEILAGAIGLFGRAAAAVQIGTTPFVRQHVFDGRAAFGLCALDAQALPGLRCIPLLEAPLGLVWARGFAMPPAVERATQLTDLAGVRLVRFDDDALVSVVMRGQPPLAAYSSSPIAVGSTEASLGLVHAGLVAMLCPATRAAELVASGLRFLALPQVLPQLRIGLICRADQPFDRERERMMQLASDAVLRVPWHASVRRLRGTVGSLDAASADLDAVGPKEVPQACAMAGQHRRHQASLQPTGSAAETGAGLGGVSHHKLLAFMAVAECRCAGAAAHMLRVSQPGVSRAVQGLEAVLGQAMFTRKSDGMLLTEAGRLFLPHAQRVSAAYARLLDAVSSGAIQEAARLA